MAATKTPSRRKRAAPRATELLAADHREVETLCGKYRAMAEAGAAAGDRRPLAEEICTLLTVHAAIEEEIFYPAARAAGVASGVLDEAEVEHASAKDLVAQIRDMDADDDLYDAKVKVLGEYVEHHAGRKRTRCSRGASPRRSISSTSFRALPPARPS
jgi:hypothetical protein